MDGEVSSLLDAIRRRDGRLAASEAALSARLRWGVAVLQAKGDLSAKRRAFVCWR